jgi:dolichol-phosphate mannosyltransferase
MTDREIPEFKEKRFFPKSNDYCVCIPVINEGDRIQKQLMGMANIAKMADIIICDGGSSDGSLNDKLLKNTNVRALLIKTGPGKLSAQLRMGYAWALDQGYKGIVTIDGNGKDGVEGIGLIIDRLKSGFDFVQGSRFIKGGKGINTPLSRFLAIKFIHAPLVSLLAGFKFTDTTNGFRGYSGKFISDNRVKPFRDVFVTYELLPYLSVKAARLGFKVTEVPVTRSYPKNEIPTKIHGFAGNWLIIKILFNLMSGKYEPKDP